MNKEFLIQLTQNLYRLTLLFPRKEPMRYKMREIADDILDNFLRITNNNSKGTENHSPQLLKDLEILDCFFEVAKNQNWVSPNEILRLQQEYNKLEGVFEKVPEAVLEVKPQLEKFPSPIALEVILPFQEKDSRHKKILEFLEKNGRAQVWQLKQVFPAITKRTLRRDFENLLKRGIIERIGERNDTFYQLMKRAEA